MEEKACSFGGALRWCAMSGLASIGWWVGTELVGTWEKGIVVVDDFANHSVI